jgi:hypothetical protein
LSGTIEPDQQYPDNQQFPGQPGGPQYPDGQHHCEGVINLDVNPYAFLDTDGNQPAG